MKYAYIKGESKRYGVREMCNVLNVGRSGYYDWKTRPASKRELFDKYLATEIRQIHVKSRSNYGTIKTWKALNLKGIYCGRNRVMRIRRINGIESKRRKRFQVTTKSKNTKWIAPNILNRCFKAARPNKVWVGDTTCISTRTGWLYLAILIDLYSRKAIGWAMSEKNDKQLVLKALEMALMKRKPQPGVLHHTDRGATYGSDDYRHKLTGYGFVSSMSRKGDCWDNAVAESFFSTLKNELIFGERFASEEYARSEVFKFIEIFYNRQRLHQALNYVTPERMELASVS